MNGFLSTDDITDAHIDGFVKFAPGNVLVTMNQSDLLYWGLSQTDITTLYAASNINNVVYTKVYIPLTQNNVTTQTGTALPYKGSYANYYVANNRVLVPNYNDPNDVIANNIIAGLYPGRTVVGIDVRNLYENGGMVHCVTQQQPAGTVLGLNQFENNLDIKMYPNPTQDSFQIQSKSLFDKLEIYNELGQLVLSKNDLVVNESISVDNLQAGIYLVKLYSNEVTRTLKLIKQ